MSRHNAEVPLVKAHRIGNNSDMGPNFRYKLMEFELSLFRWQ